MKFPTPFLDSTVDAANNITSLFNFAWPVATGLWNLRWQVAGYTSINPDVSEEELHNRFVKGSGVTSAALRLTCIKTPWEQQKEELARIVLINLFAIYETWAIRTGEEIGLSEKESENFGKNLQFPTKYDKAGKPVNGFLYAQSKYLSPDAVMTNEVYPATSSATKIHPNHIEEMLVAYRYFKECRNGLMHFGGIAGKASDDAFANLTTMSASAVPFPIPQHHPIAKGKPIHLSLHGTVGFGDIALRLIHTLDACLLKSERAKNLLFKRWKHEYGRPSLKADPRRRAKQIARLIAKLRCPRPIATFHLDSALKHALLVS